MTYKVIKIINRRETVMKKSRFLILMCFALLLGAIPWGVHQGHAAPPAALVVDNNPNSPGFGYYIPDYFFTPNWANSPALAKFVDTLPGLCGTVGGKNALGQCIPIAVADTTTYPDSEYYEIELVQYREKMHTVVTGRPTRQTPNC
jgi:hypothetical protein